MKQLTNPEFYEPMVSYAQNAEDVILRRAFADQASGFYIDIGAAHPVIDSVTKHFYDQGWQGINIEPQPLFYRYLARLRPRDINLDIAIGAKPSTTSMATFPSNEGLATLSQSIADHHRQKGYAAKAIEVKVRPLESVLQKYADRRIDFIKVDVEGEEATVLKSFDIKKWQPRVLVIESTFPNTQNPTHHEWEDILLEANYHFCLFDGLNRFYALNTEPELISRLSLSANIFDKYIPYRFYVHLPPQRQIDLKLLFNERYTLWHSKSYALIRSIVRAAVQEKLGAPAGVASVGEKYS